jgi:hypothetical protein
MSMNLWLQWRETFIIRLLTLLYTCYCSNFSFSLFDINHVPILKSSVAGQWHCQSTASKISRYVTDDPNNFDTCGLWHIVTRNVFNAKCKEVRFSLWYLRSLYSIPVALLRVRNLKEMATSWQIFYGRVSSVANQLQVGRNFTLVRYQPFAVSDTWRRHKPAVTSCTIPNLDHFVFLISILFNFSSQFFKAGAQITGRPSVLPGWQWQLKSTRSFWSLVIRQRV